MKNKQNKNLLIAEQYFEAWNERSIISLDELFHIDVILEDWEVKIDGKSQLLSHIQGVLGVLPDLQVIVLSMTISGSKIIAEIEVKLDLCNTIQVVDVLHFVDCKIKYIKAYKC